MTITVEIDMPTYLALKHAAQHLHRQTCTGAIQTQAFCACGHHTGGPTATILCEFIREIDRNTWKG